MKRRSRKATRKRTHKRQAAARTILAELPPKLPEGLTESQLTFCLEYLANGFNGSAAYKAAYPDVTDGTARANAWRLLTNANVRSYINPKLEEVWKVLQVGAEETLGRVGRDSQVNIRDLYDPVTGNMLPPHQWPDSIAGSVKSIQDGPYGLKVTLVDPLAARRIILEQSGKIKGLGESVDALAQAIRADREAHGVKE